MIRDDISGKLVHLTRGESDQAAADAFMSILTERSLRGGSGCIKGGYTCVCFSEAPLSKLTQILANPMAHGMRYKPFGVMVDKKWLFERGGRPVIYQPDAEFALLDDSQKYRHVRYEPEAVGLSSTGRLVVVSHTEADDFIRIISAREATTHERKNYES